MSGGGFTDVRRFAELDSTNRYLMDEARAGAPEGVVAVADHQRAGRGRLGRRWEAPPGTNLLVSVLLRPDVPAGELHLCSMAVALAAADACAAVAGVAPDLKWPNDLLVGGAKVAGVLAESEPGGPGAGPPAVVVGIGVNVAWPGPVGVGGTSLQESSGREVDRDALLHAFLAELARRRPGLNTPLGRRQLVDAWRRRCVTLGQVVRVEQASGELTGTAVALTDAGHLVVEAAGAAHTVAAGDVVHLRPGGPPEGPK